MQSNKFLCFCDGSDAFLPLQASVSSWSDSLRRSCKAVCSLRNVSMYRSKNTCKVMMWASTDLLICLPSKIFQVVTGPWMSAVTHASSIHFLRPWNQWHEVHTIQYEIHRCWVSLPCRPLLVDSVITLMCGIFLCQWFCLSSSTLSVVSIAASVPVSRSRKSTFKPSGHSESDDAVSRLRW